MPAISLFYGIVIYMYYLDSRQHSVAHIHASYQGQEAVFAIGDGEILAGHLPPSRAKLVQAWIEIHRDDLVADWDLAVAGQVPLPIEPLR